MLLAKFGSGSSSKSKFAPPLQDSQSMSPGDFRVERVLGFACNASFAVTGTISSSQDCCVSQLVGCFQLGT